MPVTRRGLTFSSISYHWKSNLHRWRFDSDVMCSLAYETQIKWKLRCSLLRHETRIQIQRSLQKRTWRPLYVLWAPRMLTRLLWVSFFKNPIHNQTSVYLIARMQLDDRPQWKFPEFRWQRKCRTKRAMPCGWLGSFNINCRQFLHYCSLYISLGTCKENLFNNQELLDFVIITSNGRN